MLHPLEIKRSVNPGSELLNAFNLLDKASVPRGTGAILCMRPKLSAVDADNFIVPIWMIWIVCGWFIPCLRNYTLSLNTTVVHNYSCSWFITNKKRPDNAIKISYLITVSGSVLFTTVTVVTVKSQEIICPVTGSSPLLMRLSTTGISGNSKILKKLYSTTIRWINYKKVWFSTVTTVTSDYNVLRKAPYCLKESTDTLVESSKTHEESGSPIGTELRASCTE